ncbi:DNA-directed RNA polymerase II subunit RPB2 [Apostasia shenzhenica]|uniref:DNA-directed RNA polymerase subunit beta n=1 Tax=Apostasia shenzhenica TaxID=1088818 RepID=A0A2H9ZXL0_9ASPA|nr:DNA-directed RNA polymerase II subunit RPB2 [Apostasia shenzhenica]
MESQMNDNYASLRELVRHHVESFDYFLDEGLAKALMEIRPCKIVDKTTGSILKIFVEKHYLYPPTKEGRRNEPIYPAECRQTMTSYRGEFKIEVGLQYDGGVVVREKISFGHLPIMLMSKLCHLKGVDPQRLVHHKEEASEVGGYFICNGLERLGRVLMIQKRNHPVSLVRRNFRGRGDGFSDKAVRIRCVREDQSSVNFSLYYLQNGSARAGFRILGKEYLLPVGLVLKALIDTSDHEIYVSLTCCYSEKFRNDKGAVGTQLVGERAQIILDELRSLSLMTRSQCLKHIGNHFRPVLSRLDAESDTAFGEAVLRDYVLVHLNSNHDKFNLLIFMLQKLFALVDQTAAPDHVDALQNMEVLLIGHVMTVYIKEKLEAWLEKGKRLIIDEMNRNAQDFDFRDLHKMKKIVSRYASAVSRSIESLIKVGRVVTLTGLDLPQTEGLTIQAERLNYLRFISHFRSVHRGASFAKMRTTTVRKLLPESWGFLCPVHTPDGIPCGLLNHLASTCRIASFYDRNGLLKDFAKIRMSILSVLIGLGMTPLLPRVEHTGPPEVLHVLLDGCVIGSMASDNLDKAVWHLRSLKLSSSSGIPDDLEVGYVPLSEGGAYPGLYLFCSPSRFIRPVKNISISAVCDTNVELVGPFEQAFMEISCPDNGDGGRRESFPATHEEIHPTAILSVIANLTPWSDHNQSPRNMYQCQMAKQTMGFSGQALQFRADNKTYHLQTPQSPIVRTASYTKFCVDEFPTGANAIVAVLAYSGYDMEDAMILNKSSVERGLFRGHIYQTETIDLANKKKGAEKVLEIFSRGTNKGLQSSVDSDGLPFVGQTIQPGGPKYSSYNTLTSTTSTSLLKGSESLIVDYIAVDGSATKNYIQKVNLRSRRVRNPVIGDKFSSRHGQKGVCSQLWPDVDMPFSAVTGIRPDLIINPHAFPSRMTIGMLLESIAAKGGSLQGKFVDATPFASSTLKNDADKSSEKVSLVDEIGPILASYGFNYHGLEVLYSGVLGTELTCEIFIGPVYYQRLRHMVSDKFQVRSTGAVDQITRQPIGGRKRGGGIRFGEMERDSILAHGAAYLLHDRLHSSSDYHIADVCSQCGSLLTSTIVQPQKREFRDVKSGLPPLRSGSSEKNATCVYCKSSKRMETVAMPYVFRFLAAELAAMNVKLDIRLSNSSSS